MLLTQSATFCLDLTWTRTTRHSLGSFRCTDNTSCLRKHAHARDLVVDVVREALAEKGAEPLFEVGARRT